MRRGPEWAGMAPVKMFEGTEIRLDPESGKFGAYLGEKNLRLLKDLKALEREILEQRKTVRVFFLSSYRRGPSETPEVKEIVRFKDGRYYFKGGDQANWGLYEYDERILADMQGLEQEYDQLLERWKQVHQRMVPLKQERYEELKKENDR